MKKIIYAIIVSAALCSCELDLTPPDKLSAETAFNSENDLKLYTNSFYQALPSATDIQQSDASIVSSDYYVGRSISSYLQNSFNSSSASGWDWKELRNINYFLQHYQQAGVSDDIKAKYTGLARFFRAWFYFNKIKRFGDVPWYNTPLDVNDPDLYKPRDSRALVMDSVLADINYACNNLSDTKDNTCTMITKWVALAVKSRICLFEGTFRKYHSELNMSSTAGQWLEQSADAALKVMESGKYSIYSANPLNMSYRSLFINETPNATETLLSAVCSASLSIYNDANWYWVSTTYGGRYSLTKTFVDTYLSSDGSRFTDKTNYDKVPFWEEVKNRDLRLQQTIRMGDYSRAGVATPPDFNYTYTGYQPLKFTLDSKATDGEAKNTNSLPIIRYAEVLLNYAEAKAELGTFTESDWAKTIKVLRARAGITNSTFPSTADQYLRDNYFPEISNAALLEIRRERSIELVMEGFRYDDLKRWKKGNLLEMEYCGMYVPAMNTLYDVNQDGKMDVCFVTKIPSPKVSGVIYFIIDKNQYKLSDGDSGNLVLFTNLSRSYDDYKYFYPIPESEITLNPKLEQNPGWD